MKNKKKFDIDKAKKLAIIYNRKRHFKREEIVNQLISFQEFFGDNSIVGATLLLDKEYKRKTIKKVIKDLGYSLTFFENDYHGIYPAKTSKISFKRK